MYLLIIKVNDDTKVLMTPMGPQIWMRLYRTAEVSCAVCKQEIKDETAYAPVAAPILLNPGERIHTHCMDAMELLPMQTNPTLMEGGNMQNTEPTIPVTGGGGRGDPPPLPAPDTDTTRPVYGGPEGGQIGHTHETLQESLTDGEHEWHVENPDGTETVVKYTVDDDHW